MTAEISKEERAAFIEMAASFARRSIGPILEHESADGDLSRIPGILDQAFETGLLASPDPEAPGHQAGIWGTHTALHGPRLSLSLLEELAVACGGTAINLHALGLGSLIAGMAKNPPPLPGRIAVALNENGFPPWPGTIREPAGQNPARIETVASKD